MKPIDYVQLLKGYNIHPVPLEFEQGLTTTEILGGMQSKVNEVVDVVNEFSLGADGVITTYKEEMSAIVDQAKTDLQEDYSHFETTINGNLQGYKDELAAVVDGNKEEMKLLFDGYVNTTNTTIDSAIQAANAKIDTSLAENQTEVENMVNTLVPTLVDEEMVESVLPRYLTDEKLNGFVDQTMANGYLKAVGELEILTPRQQQLIQAYDLTIVRTPTKTILIDTGYPGDWTNIQAWLLSLNITNIDVVVISHYHQDHCGNLSNILNLLPHKKCTAYVAKQSNHADEGVWYTNTRNTLTSANVNIVEPDNITVTLESNLSIRFMNNTAADIAYYTTNTSDYNNYSMCCEIVYNNLSLFFSGDINITAQERLFGLGLIHRVDFYKVHHHAVDQTFSKNFIDSISPSIAVVEVNPDKYNEYGYRSPVVPYLLGLGTQILCTGYSDDVKILGVNNSLNIVSGELVQDYSMTLFNMNIYVDASVPNDAIRRGTQTNPYKTLKEAIGLIQPIKNVKYTINLAPGDYDSFELRGFSGDIKIVGNGTVNIPEGVVSGCNWVEINGINFTYGTRNTILAITASTVVVDGCKFVNSIGYTNQANSINCYMATVYIKNCTFNNQYVCVYNGVGNVYVLSNVGSGNRTYCLATSGTIYVDKNNSVAAELLYNDNYHNLIMVEPCTGNTASRPTLSGVINMTYYDTTLGKPVFWQQNKWIDATGATV